MSFRPRSNLLLTLSQIFGTALDMNKYYIVSTKRERQARYPHMERHTSRTKSRKRRRSIVRMRGGK